MEKLPNNSFERHDNIEKVESFLSLAAARYRESGVPVGETGRIDEQSYEGFYETADIEEDLRASQKREKKWHEGLSPEEIQKKKRLMEGEQLEMLACAIFTKNFGDDFVVVRSSLHDDQVNNVDTVILDKKTGSLVCAFDEVSDVSGASYQEKEDLVRRKNVDDGTSLKYGVGMSDAGGEKKR